MIITWKFDGTGDIMLSQKMDLANQVQILDKTIEVSLHAKVFGEKYEPISSFSSYG